MIRLNVLGFGIRIGKQTDIDRCVPAWMSYPLQDCNQRISGKDILQICREHPNVFTNANYIFTDIEYKLVDVEHLKGWLEVDCTSSRQYIANDHDCDDFAVSVHGHMTDWDPPLANAIVFAYTPNNIYHAFNAVVSTKRELVFFEPQNNAILTNNDFWGVTHFMFL